MSINYLSYERLPILCKLFIFEVALMISILKATVVLEGGYGRWRITQYYICQNWRLEVFDF